MFEVFICVFSEVARTVMPKTETGNSPPLALESGDRGPFMSLSSARARHAPPPQRPRDRHAEQNARFCAPVSVLRTTTGEETVPATLPKETANCRDDLPGPMGDAGKSRQ